MREIGSLSDQEDARTFSDYLLTRGIKSSIEEEEDQWTIWIIEEDQVDKAREELQEFRDSPHAPIYREAADAAADLRRVTARKAEKAAKRRRKLDMPAPWQRPVYQRVPVTFALIVISGAVFMATGFGQQVEPVRSALSITPLEDAGAGRASWYPDKGLEKIREGQIWRIFTPMFLHGGWMHILFNMYWLYLYGNMLELRYGWWRFLLIALLTSAAGNLPQYFFSGPFFGGMSGVVFGLFGYLWIKTKFAPWEGFFLPPNLVLFTFIFFFLCMTGMVGPIANYAHAGGLISGAALAYMTIRR